MSYARYPLTPTDTLNQLTGSDPQDPTIIAGVFNDDSADIDDGDLGRAEPPVYDDNDLILLRDLIAKDPTDVLVKILRHRIATGRRVAVSNTIG